MNENKVLNFIKDVLENMPDDWTGLTTHRLDIYNEELAKTEFLEGFESLYTANNSDKAALNDLPTAFDYIRLGHPLSSVLEWTIAKLNNINPDDVISFSSNTIPILAILRKNLFLKKNTLVAYSDELPSQFDPEVLKNVYGYTFDLIQVDSVVQIPKFDGSIVFIAQQDLKKPINFSPNIDFFISLHDLLGSLLLVNGEKNETYISEIQHVRRRETIAMTPADCLSTLRLLVESSPVIAKEQSKLESNKKLVLDSIREITGTHSNPLLGSSGLSVQYAIMMGLIDHAMFAYPGKEIKIVVPPNCYGGTNDQARRVAACLENVEVLDLLVDGDNDMVRSVDSILNKVASEDAVPFIIAEIPTNPRVEVPDLEKLKEALSLERKTQKGKKAIDPVFILDQTFCPNVQFLAEGGILSTVRSIAYVSGSKFPSGGKCTAGYCVANEKAEELMGKIARHLMLCDNEATSLQVKILAEQLPSMNQRIHDAYKNTREFVNHIKKKLPEAKINFVSEELALKGFTPSVFSLDLPTKGSSHEERESSKRALNDKLINLMITEIPDESKYCVSYGQLKGCYWTIPATSTQGTTKEADKDYIARVAVSADLDLNRHKEVFSTFVASID
ncbi:cystathionine beta-synthase [Ekhidna sp. To15]|uniref:cystathionine beta-synthase n=1 Tax=Ekhidna sp. To15 TaxID=3395267 RepID=UPI003F51C0BF